MSASKEKKNRVDQPAPVGGRKRADEELMKEKKFRRNAIIAVVCIVLVVAAAIVINSNLFYTGMTAVKIGNTGYSAAEVDVFYRNTYNTVYNSYGSLASYVLDTSTPLTEQNYSEDQTWADYLYAQTLENMRQITALYDEAQAKGFTPNAAALAQVDEQLQSMADAAASNGFPDVDRFLAAVFGKGVDSKVFRNVLTKTVIASEYSNSVREAMTYDADKLDSYYAEHKDELDSYSFYSYLVSTSAEAFSGLDDEAKVAAAHDAAAEIAAAKTLAEFQEKVDAFSAGAAASEHASVSGGNLDSYYSDYSAWLKDAARRENDTTAADAEGGTYAVLFVSRSDNGYTLKNMRHILINAEADENGEYTDAAKAAAEARIREIAAEWEADPTEEHFAELANSYSEDAGSNTTGGLYENIYEGQMVPNINAFLFDESRKPGDTATVYGESSAYQGWHLVYYVGEGQRYRDYLAENALRNADYTAWVESLTANYTAADGSAQRYIKLS